MEIAQIRKKLTQVDHLIDRAAQAVRHDQGASEELKAWVQELGAQAKEAQQSLNDGESTMVIECVDIMEEASDQAKKACEGSRNLGPQTRSAVMTAHQQLSELKHQLH